MSKARIYFYKDAQGVTQKYIYCNMCGNRFTADQEYNPDNPETKLGLFMSTGKHIAFCIPCAKIVGFLRPPEPEPTQSFVGPRPEKGKKK